MTLPPKLPVFLFVIGGLLAAAPLAEAGTAGVDDNAGFFSANAKSDAASNIRDLQKTLKKDVCVETFAEIPAEMRQGVNLQNKASLNNLFETWAIKRAREQSVNGVYILLVKEPAHLHAIVGNETQKQAFTLADRDALVRTMLAKLRAKDYDAALREGVTFIVSTMKSHAGTQARPASTPDRAKEPASSFGGWLVPLLVLGVLAWLAFGLIRSLFRRGTAPGADGTPMAGGGGGFGRSLLGGLFGAAAGMWMYDHFFGSHGSSAYGATPPEHDRFGDGGTGASPFGGAQDTDYSGSGGDFGAGSGGGDVGGGGGDSGGGGGDF